MVSALVSIGKNLILLGIAIISLVNFYFNWFSWKELMGIQLLAGLSYIFLSCYEYLNTSFKASLPVQRFPYFSNQFFMARFIKIGVFLSFGVFLFMSDSRVQAIFPICLLVAATEGIITFLKVRGKLCFVNVYANYLLIAETQLNKVFASELLIVEFRHSIFYFVKKDRKTLTIKLEHINQQEEFIQKLNDWLERNQVTVSPESKSKIKELIL